MESNSVQKSTRRKFILGSLISSLAGFFIMLVYPIVRFIMPPPIPESSQNSVNAATIDELQPGSAKIFPFGNKPAILIRMPNGEYRAFSAVCTHLQCTVQYRDDLKLIWCACHNGKYDLNGNVVSGPPPAPLEAFDVNIGGKDVIVSKKA
jgi:cytochrome b6-f complex iron-sulfur subunit